jgi:hypothetical protein
MFSFLQTFKPVLIAGGLLAILFFWGPGVPPGGTGLDQSPTGLDQSPTGLDQSPTGLDQSARMEHKATQTDSLLTDYIIVEYV